MQVAMWMEHQKLAVVVDHDSRIVIRDLAGYVDGMLKVFDAVALRRLESARHCDGGGWAKVVTVEDASNLEAHFDLFWTSG